MSKAYREITRSVSASLSKMRKDIPDVMRGFSALGDAAMLGGTWLASFTADRGAGIFDGAYLVENFENLNPANTFWDKYYHLYANVDTEPPRFLEFERWWGGFFLMNREEIEWITRNLFVGNKLWKGGAAGGSGSAFDLRDIKVPIILFASMIARHTWRALDGR